MVTNSYMGTNDVCYRCGRHLDPKKTVSLELDMDTNEFTDKPLQNGHQSQGMFDFGADCAKRILKNDGVLDRCVDWD